MDSFDDAVARRIRSNQQASNGETARRAGKTQVCAAAATEMTRLLEQFADHLN
ncbi:hypothetical protein, partial [Nocardia ignorata]|uniref:hypothetical protein n=1 Tax=Nocardia ignorata TaxID=145285 RepID=UPI0012EE5477